MTIGYLSIINKSRLLAKITKGMLRPSPDRSRKKLPCEAPPTASVLSAAIVISAIVISLTACITVFDPVSLSSSVFPSTKSLTAIQMIKIPPIIFR